MTNLDLASEPPPLAATSTSTSPPLTSRDVHDRRSVVAGVLALAGGVGEDRGAQLVVGVEIGAAHSFVDHIFDGHGRVVPADVHADLEKDVDDAGVLADGAVTLGAHARVDQDLRDRVLGGVRLLALVGLGQIA